MGRHAWDDDDDDVCDAPRRTMTAMPAMWVTHHRPELGKDCCFF